MSKLAYTKLWEEMIDNILSIRSTKKLKDVFWRVFYNNNIACKNKCGKQLTILILNTPCNGFGDIMFAMKLVHYLKKWYGAKVTVATPWPAGFISLGMDKSSLIELRGRQKNNKQCRRLKLLSSYNMYGKAVIPKADLYFIAPIPYGQVPDLRDVKYLIKNANQFNTRWFSEYNLSYPKKYDFPTGVGKNYDGLFLTKPKVGKRLKKLPNPYVMCYIAELESTRDIYNCLLSFIEMVVVKYQKHTKFDIIVPPWITDYMSSLKKRILNTIGDIYPTVILRTKQESIILRKGTGKRKLTLRADIFPVPNKIMLRIMRHSLKDILVTGDQSITDVLSCCPEKNIFYQIAFWKTRFAKKLAQNMPNKYLLEKKTACGTLNALKYKSNYKKFINEWNFQTKGKPKLDAIILSALARKKNKKIKSLYNLAVKSKTLKSLKNKVYDL